MDVSEEPAPTIFTVLGFNLSAANSFLIFLLFYRKVCYWHYQWVVVVVVMMIPHIHDLHCVQKYFCFKYFPLLKILVLFCCVHININGANLNVVGFEDSIFNTLFRCLNVRLLWNCLLHAITLWLYYWFIFYLPLIYISLYLLSLNYIFSIICWFKVPPGDCWDPITWTLCRKWTKHCGRYFLPWS